MDDFHYAKEAIGIQPPNQRFPIFTVSKDEWNTKEECIACTAVCQKAPLRLK